MRAPRLPCIFLICIHDHPAIANQRMRDWLGTLAAPRADGIRISASVGCAAYRPGTDAMQLYREADAAMYAAKAQGGATLVCDDGDHRQAPGDPQWVTAAEPRAASRT